MKSTKILSLLSFILLSVFATAQDQKAKDILDKVSSETKGYNSITSTFTFTLDDNAADVHQSQDGKIIIKDGKYMLELGENTIYSDGKTQWTYSKEMNEVYIDNAGGAQGNLNPDKLFTLWENGFKQYYDSEGTVDGTPVHVIKLNPTDPSDKTYHTIKTYIGKNDNQLKKVEILGKQGDNYTYKVKTFKADIDYNDATFTFNKNQHPGVEVIDNR